MTCRNLINITPCNGSVKKSARIVPIREYFTLISLVWFYPLQKSIADQYGVFVPYAMFLQMNCTLVVLIVHRVCIPKSLFTQKLPSPPNVRQDIIYTNQFSFSWALLVIRLCLWRTHKYPNHQKTQPLPCGFASWGVLQRMHQPTSWFWLDYLPAVLSYSLLFLCGIFWFY